ncbi:hypothetical protein SM139_3919, partial [Stenotrophomonas maltophilia]
RRPGHRRHSAGPGAKRVQGLGADGLRHRPGAGWRKHPRAAGPGQHHQGDDVVRDRRRGQERQGPCG